MCESNEKLLDLNYEAWRAHDVNKIVSYFAEDASYEDMAMGVTFHGKEEIASFASEVFSQMPDFHVEYAKRFATERFGAGQWIITATFDGEFEGIDCTGKRIEFTGLSYYSFESGKIATAQDCWDYTAMMQAFGVLRQSLRHLD